MKELEEGEIVRMESCVSIGREDDGTLCAAETHPVVTTDYVFMFLGHGDHVEDFHSDKQLAAILRSFGWTVTPPTESS